MSLVDDSSEWRVVPPFLAPPQFRTAEDFDSNAILNCGLEEVAWRMIEDFNLKLNRTIGRCKSCR